MTSRQSSLHGALATALAASIVVMPVMASPYREPDQLATQTFPVEMGGLLGWSPKPTAGPVAPDWDLMRRADRVEVRGSDTCGYAEGFKSDPWTCYALGASCSTYSGYLGCCETTGDCAATFITKCFDFTDVQSGSCETADRHTLCCTSRFPSCWGWTSTPTDSPVNTVTAWNCLASGGLGSLFDQPPGATTTVVSGQTVSETTEPDSTSDLNIGAPNPTSDEANGGGVNEDDQTNVNGTNSDGSSSNNSNNYSNNNGTGDGINNTGAIVGGVLGGLALIAIIVLGVGYFLWRKRRQAQNGSATTNVAAVPPSQPQPNGGGYQSSPPLSNRQQNSFYGANSMHATDPSAPGSTPQMQQYSPGLNQQTQSWAQPPPPGGVGGWDPRNSAAYSTANAGNYIPGQEYPQGMHQQHSMPHEMPPHPKDTQLGSVNNRAELGQ